MHNWAVVSQRASASVEIVNAAVLLMDILQVMLMPTEVGLHPILLQYGFKGWQHVHVVVGPVVAPDWMMPND